MNDRTIIKSLHIKNFGCFSDKKIVFGPELNLIFGGNESGKSTVIKALFTVLFEDGSTKKKTVGSWANWSSEKSFKLALEFSVGDKDFNLIRDYEAGRDIMTDSDGLTYEGKTISEKLALYFGTIDRCLFESVFCFSSDHPAAPEMSKDRLKAAVELPVFYGFDRSRADRYLDDEIKKLDNPRAHGPRELDLIGEQISSCLQEKNDLEKRLDALNKNRQELEEVKAKADEHEAAVERLDKEIEGGTAYAALNEKMANLEDRLQVHLGNYSRAVQVAEDLQRVEKATTRIRVPHEDEMTTITLERDELRTHVDETKVIMDELIVRRQKSNRSFVAATLILALLCLTYVGQHYGYLMINAVTDILPYTIPVMALVWLFRLAVYLIQYSRKKKAAVVFREAVSRLDVFYEGLNLTYNLKAADPVRGLEEAIQRRQSLLGSAENLRNTLEALSEGKGLDYLNTVRQQLENEVAALNKELTPLTSFMAASGKLPDLKEELISRRVRANALRERAALLTERCSAIEGLQKEISRVDNEVEILKRKHIDITERLEILKITRNALNRAADNLIEDTFEAYGAAASNFLASLTDGRYNQLRFIRESSRYEVKIGDTDNWHEISESLSSSTRDSIYVALRLAGVAILSSDFCPPIIFDQAEARMDGKRQSAFFDLIKKNSLRRQIFFVGLNKTDQLGKAHLIEMAESKRAVQASPAT